MTCYPALSFAVSGSSIGRRVHILDFMPSSTCRMQVQFRPLGFGENRQLVTNEPVEFEKRPVEVQDFGKITQEFMEYTSN